MDMKPLSLGLEKSHTKTLKAMTFAKTRKGSSSCTIQKMGLE